MTPTRLAGVCRRFLERLSQIPGGTAGGRVESNAVEPARARIRNRDDRYADTDEPVSR